MVLTHTVDFGFEKSHRLLFEVLTNISFRLACDCCGADHRQQNIRIVVGNSTVYLLTLRFLFWKRMFLQVNWTLKVSHTCWIFLFFDIWCLSFLSVYTKNQYLLSLSLFYFVCFLVLELHWLCLWLCRAYCWLCTHELLLAGLGDHVAGWRLNLGQLCARMCPVAVLFPIILPSFFVIFLEKYSPPFSFIFAPFSFGCSIIESQVYSLTSLWGSLLLPQRCSTILQQKERYPILSSYPFCW